MYPMCLEAITFISHEFQHSLSFGEKNGVEYMCDHFGGWMGFQLVRIVHRRKQEVEPFFV